MGKCSYIKYVQILKTWLSNASQYLDGMTVFSGPHSNHVLCRCAEMDVWNSKKNGLGQTEGSSSDCTGGTCLAAAVLPTATFNPPHHWVPHE